MFRSKFIGALFISLGISCAAPAEANTVTPPAPPFALPAERAAANGAELRYLLSPVLFATQHQSSGRFATAASGLPNLGSIDALYAFGGSDGNTPDSLTRDAAGNMYGTTFGGGRPCGCGTVFKLTPPGIGHTAWTETVLYAFAGGVDGGAPDSALIVDRSGSLYGTTFGGGDVGFCLNGCGTVFKLTPPSAGQAVWSESILHRFSGLNGDGVAPDFSNLIALDGSLYGTTATGGMYGGGIAYRLTPLASEAGIWNETILHAFGFPGGGDGSQPGAGFVTAGGALYSTTSAGGGTGCGGSGCGTVYKLTPSPTGQTAWLETILYTFHGPDGYAPALDLAIAPNGSLFGATEYGGDTHCNSARGCGTVFALSPNVGRAGWTQSVIHYFTGNDGFFPYSGVLGDAHGNLYGTTEGGGAAGYGTVFKLSPPATGTTAWRRSVLHAFTGGSDGGYPVGNVVEDPNGAIYGGAGVGGAAPCSCGIVFAIPR